MNDIDELTQLFDRMAGEAPEPLTLPRGTEGKIRSAQLRRYASVGLVAVLVAAGIILPLKALLPLADRDKVQPQGPASPIQIPSWSPPWTIPAPPFDPALSGEALARALSIPQISPDACEGTGFLGSGRADEGWCIPSEYNDLEVAQIVAGLRGESLDDPTVREDMFMAIAGQARLDGDLVKAAEAGWASQRDREVNRGIEDLRAPAIVAAEPGQPTTEITDPIFGYPMTPFDANGPVSGAKQDAAFAWVSFSYRWSGPIFTQPAACDIQLTGTAGEVVGRRIFMMYPNADHPGRPEGTAAWPVLVTSTPQDIHVSCSTALASERSPSSARSESPWPSAPPITEEMLGLPNDWNGLTGQALADHLNLAPSDSKTCDGWSSGGWCTADAGHLSQAQQMGLLILLNGESFESPVSQSRLAYALIADPKKAGDDPRAADLNWMYVERPRILEDESYFAVSPPVIPAAPGEDTYVFANIDFTYPYVPDGVKGATPDHGFASLSFESDWSGDVYPGPADCEVRFLSAGGTDVGGLSSGWSQHTRHIDAAGLLGPAFPVTGVPVRVSWACSAGTKPVDGATLEQLQMGRADGHLQLTAVLRAPTAGEGGPGTQVCTISGTAPDGSTVTAGGHSTLDVADGTKINMVLPGSFEGAADLQASCHPFTGQGG